MKILNKVKEVPNCPYKSDEWYWRVSYCNSRGWYPENYTDWHRAGRAYLKSKLKELLKGVPDGLPD